MNYNNLSKTFRYVNSEGGEIIFDYENGYLINKPVGIDTLQVSHAQSQGINQIGSSIQASNIQPRAINITGRIMQSGTGLKDKLLSVIRPDLWGKLYADEYCIDVKPTSTPAIGPEEDFSKFTFSILAPYPYFQSVTETAVVLSGIDPKFKLPVNLTDEYQFGARMALQFINVFNKGQVSVPFTLTIEAAGSVTNPKLINAQTGKFLKINKTMASGERIVVQITHDKTFVTSSVDGDIRGALTLDSDLLALDVGDNVLKPTADSGESYVSMSILFAHELVGITV